MRPIRFSADILVDLLRQQTVATMLQLRDALGDCAQRTVERKLRDIPHHTSYSHSGRFYALADQPQFDAHGLWSFRGVRFSAHGNLLDTVAALVRDSRAGYRGEELDALLQVRCGAALRKLTARARVARERRRGSYWYHAVEPARSARQRRTRDAWDALEAPPGDAPPARGDLAAALHTFLETLDERQRRWFAGWESLRRGHGGDRRAAALLGMHPSTVARGRRELAAGEALPGRVRQPGGGRQPVEKKSPRSSDGSRT